MKTRAILGLVAAAGLASVANAQFTLNWTARVGTVSGTVFTPLASQPSPLVVGPGQSVQYRLSWTSARAIDDAVTVGSTPGVIAGIFYVGMDIKAADANLNGGVINNQPAGAGNSLNGVVGSGNQGIFAASQFIVTPGSGAPAPSGLFVSITRQPNGAPQVPAQVNFGSASSPIWQMTWTPTDLSPRSVNWSFGVPPALAALGGAAQYLVNVDPDPANSFLDAFLPTTVNFGSMPAVSVVPAPASLALLGLGGLVAARRRRA